MLGVPERLFDVAEGRLLAGGCKAVVNRADDELEANSAFFESGSCDREIDREALAKTLYDKICHSMSWENVDYATYTMYIEFADHLISTMPTWFKPTERK